MSPRSLSPEYDGASVGRWRRLKVATATGAVALLPVLAGCGGEQPCNVDLPFDQTGVVATKLVKSPDGKNTIYATASRIAGHKFNVVLSDSVFAGNVLESGVLTDDPKTSLTYPIDPNHVFHLEVVDGNQVQGYCTTINNK